MAVKKFKYRWREGGVQHKKSFSTKLQMLAFTAENEGRLARGEKAPSEQKLTFQAFCVIWLAEYASVEKAESTVKEDEAVISRYLIPALGELMLSKLSAENLLELRAKLKQTVSLRTKRPLSPKTVNNILTLAKGILEHAKDRKLLPSNPWSSVGLLPKKTREMAYWTKEERDRFLVFCRHHDPEFSELVLVAVHTGLRLGELQALTRGQLDFDRRLIRVDATYSSKVKKRKDSTKNNEVGFVPMTHEVLETLKSRKLQRMDAPVFRTAMFADPVHRLRRRCEAIGVRSIRFHDLRHSFASILVMEGVPLYSVQKLMRHKSIAMTERYAHLAPDHLREAIDRISSVPAVPAGQRDFVPGVPANVPAAGFKKLSSVNL